MVEVILNEMSASFDLFGGTFHNTEALVPAPPIHQKALLVTHLRSLGHHSELPVVGSMRSLLFLVVINIAMVVAQSSLSNTTWQQGDICAGTAGLSPRFMLTGKHLIVGDMHWERYAELDRATMTWEGFDIDLIEAISHLLGFTYTIMEFDAAPPVTQTNAGAARLRHSCIQYV